MTRTTVTTYSVRTNTPIMTKRKTMRQVTDLRMRRSEDSRPQEIGIMYELTNDLVKILNTVSISSYLQKRLNPT